ncbi:heme biosynthesis protein HemY [Shewanella hanedai]|uniref:Heme biosynthesis protein HemY n=1 Tax=Shewanella hanedai TaxID=25 RepID=A0A553JE99_SHEHA|nr:heme biosynthesis HemY N-terminal domain-containing protein [Shewanella hanedai]TRY10740.1 heme biosynthesis protein HemY [Shewanella hanedai]GGJ05221.1 heme biosynthesis protein HemY [Shewanella hanedai]
MIRVLAYLAIILIGLCISPFFDGMNGYLYLAFWDYEVEMGVVTAIVGLILFYCLLQIVEWCLVLFLNLILSSRLLPEKWRKKAARKHTLIGALALAEEDWPVAEKAMAKGAEKGEIPSLNLLAAARAAQHQNDPVSRDGYLLEAEKEPMAVNAVGTTRTRYLLQQGDLTSAREQLDKLSPSSKSKLPVLRLAIELYQAQSDFNSLKLLLPVIKKRQLLTETAFTELSVATNHALLISATENSEQELEKVWHWLSRGERKEMGNIALYCVGLNRFERKDEALKLLMKQLKHSPSAEIFAGLGELLVPSDLDERELIFSMEKKHGQDINFQILLAKLHHQNKEYRRAMECWKEVCQIQPTKSHWLALGETQEHLGEQNSAIQSYRHAIKAD